MSSCTSPTDKATLRAKARELRQSLASAPRAAFDARINELLISTEAISAARYIAAYSAFDGEPDIAPALLAMHQRGQHMCLPVTSRIDGTMRMHSWRPDSKMCTGDLGIMQPGEAQVVAAARLDVVLVPLVAWDSQGGRIGMGGGYYDRYLEAVMISDRPLRVGIAYDLQRVKHITAEPHDVGLHALVSEKGWTDFSKK